MFQYRRLQYMCLMNHASCEQLYVKCFNGSLSIMYCEMRSDTSMSADLFRKSYSVPGRNSARINAIGSIICIMQHTKGIACVCVYKLSKYTITYKIFILDITAKGALHCRWYIYTTECTQLQVRRQCAGHCGSIRT